MLASSGTEKLFILPKKKLRPFKNKIDNFVKNKTDKVFQPQLRNKWPRPLWFLWSSTCPLTGFFWLLSHVIYLKLTKVSYECLLSQSWVMGSRTSFSVSQQLRPELSAKWMLSIFSDLPLTRKTEKNVNFSMLQIFEW